MLMQILLLHVYLAMPDHMRRLDLLAYARCLCVQQVKVTMIAIQQHRVFNV